MKTRMYRNYADFLKRADNSENGVELEEKTSTLFAALQIYKKSSDIKVSPVRFYDPNKDAIADMKRCADLEIRE